MSEIITKLRNLVPGSYKPFYKTLIDAVVITILTLVATIAILLLWQELFSADNTGVTTATGAATGIVVDTASDIATGSTAVDTTAKDISPSSKIDWFTVIWQTIALTIASQFINEYSGLNGLLAESSMRYAKNRPLNKFRTVRSAACYNEYRIQHEYMGVDANIMSDNLDKLLAILRLDIVRKMLIMHNEGLTDQEIYDKLSHKITFAEFDLLLHLCGDNNPWDYLRASKELAEYLDHDDVIRYILLNGFCEFSYGNVQNAINLAKETAREYYAQLPSELSERIYGIGGP